MRFGARLTGRGSMMNVEDLKVFNGRYVEITWTEARESQGACGVFVGVNSENEAMLDWGFCVDLDARNFMMKITKEPCK
jgi:hypothetical protein